MEPHGQAGKDPMAPRLRRFIDGMSALADAGKDIDIDAAATLLRALLAHDDWLAPALAEPHPQFYRQYLLYRDPAARFTVLSFVWGPGQHTPVHNHTVWGLTGMLRGAELAQFYRLGEDGALLADGPLLRQEAGTVGVLSPASGDIHQVFNAYEDRVSVGVHVYGGDIGAIERAVFAADGSRKPFRSGYSEPRA